MTDTLIPPNPPSKTVGEIIFKNSVYITLGDIAIKALNFLFSVYVIRQLGDNRFGQYSIVLSFVGLFQIVAELGVTQYAMREMAQDANKIGKLFWNLVAVRVVLAFVGMAIISLAALVMGYSSDLILGIFIYTWSFLLAAFEAPLTAVLTARERLDFISAMNILGRLTFLVLGAIFMFSGFGYFSLIVAALLAIPIKIIIALLGLRRQQISLFPVTLNRQGGLELLKGGIPFSITTLMLSISFSIDTVILSKFRPDYIVGWYNVAYNLIFSLMFFVGGFNQAIVPSLARTHISDPANTERWYYRTIKLMMIFSFPIAVGGYLTAFPLFKFLYTPEYLPAAFGLQILIWDFPLLMYAGFCGNITTIIRQERAAARINSLNASVNIILNLYAISRFGLVGAALVTVITDFISAIQFHLLLSNQLKLPKMFSTFIRIALAAGLMGIAVWWVRELNLFLQIAIGAVVYGLLIWFFRLFSTDEMTLIKSVIQRLFAWNQNNNAPNNKVS